MGRMSTFKPLRGTRVVSLALNLPGPAALMRLAQMGARCTKINPPSGDPMQHYSPAGSGQLHQGLKETTLDLKDAQGQARLHKLLSNTDILLTSFRPSALAKLGLSWKTVHKQYPRLSLIEVVGAPGPLAEIPGHDLTYQAEVDLVPGMDLPASLFADMGGALMASEAALQAMLVQKTTGKGSHHEVALSTAAAWLALPRQWGMTTPKGAVGGGTRRLPTLRLQKWPRRHGRAGASLCATPVRCSRHPAQAPPQRPVHPRAPSCHCSLSGRQNPYAT